METRMLIFLTIALYAGAAARSVSKRQSRSAANDEFYVLANSESLLLVDVELNSTAKKLTSIKEGVVAIDFDAKSEQIFFCNSRTNTISKTGIKAGDNAVVIVEQNSSLAYRKSLEVQAIAVDWVVNKLYWIGNKTGRLVRCDLDGKNDVLLVNTTGRLKNVESMVVVPGSSAGNKTLLYLARQNAIMKVEITVTSDGNLSSTLTNLLTGANNGPGTPARLAIDRAAEKLYWFNVKNNNNVKQNKKSIKVLNLTDPNPSANDFYNDVSPVAIAVRQSIVIWVETEKSRPYIMTVDTSTNSPKRSSVTNLGTISAIAAYSKSAQQVSSDATTAPSLGPSVSSTSRSPTTQSVATQKATTDSAMTSQSSAATSGPTAPLPTVSTPSTAQSTTSISATTKSASTTASPVSTTTLPVSSRSTLTPTTSSQFTSTTASPVSSRKMPTTVKSNGVNATLMSTASSQSTSTTKLTVSATASPAASTQQPTSTSATASPSTSDSADLSTTSTKKTVTATTTTTTTTTQEATTQNVSPTLTNQGNLTDSIKFPTQKASPMATEKPAAVVTPLVATPAPPKDPNDVESTESASTEKVAAPQLCECSSGKTCVLAEEETTCLCPKDDASEGEPENCLMKPSAAGKSGDNTNKGGVFMYVGVGVGVLVLVVVIVVVLVVVRRKSKTLNYEPDQTGEVSSSKFCNPIYDTGIGGMRAASFKPQGPVSFDNSIYAKNDSLWPKSSHDDSDCDNDYQDPDEFCSKAPRSGLVNRGGAAGGSTTENPYDNGPVGAKSNHDDSDCDNDYQDPDQFCSKAPLCAEDEKNSKETHSGFVNPFFASDAAGGSSDDYLTPEKAKADDDSDYLTPEDNLYDNKSSLVPGDVAVTTENPYDNAAKKTAKADDKSDFLIPEENTYDNKSNLVPGDVAVTTDDQKPAANESSDDYLAPEACTPFSRIASGPKPTESEDNLEPTEP